ncbi:MAG: hypothetical protein JXA30_09335 [Deltaproteobacteria bacterium]|nr:hypothetical protein [Deltaproteobacteria bacterium]
MWDRRLIALAYDYEPRILPPELAERFVYLGGDEEAMRFIGRMRARPAGRWATRNFQQVRRAISDDDAYGLLNVYLDVKKNRAPHLTALGIENRSVQSRENRIRISYV